MNKETLDIFSQYLNGNKQIMMLKARQAGKSHSTMALANWRKTFDKYNRAQDRKETIKRLFNI